jgi:hypothetical protein
LDRADVPSLEGEARPRGVTVRALILGFLLLPLNVYFLTDFLWTRGAFTGYYSLFSNTVGLLFLMALLNEALKRWKPSWRFGSGELLTIYVLLGISTALTAVAWDVGGALAGVLSYPFFFANSSNGWEHMLWPYLPDWLTVREFNAIEGFYAGNSSAYSWSIIRAWAGPALWWAAFIGAIMWVCLCLNSIVRRRWADEEKLPFPLVTLPVQLADERYGLLRNRLFWLAVGLTFAVQALNFTSSILPSVPGIPLSFRWFQYTANKRPWDMIPFPVASLEPWLFGIIYLIPLDLVFSMAVFDVLWNVEFVLAGWLGWSTHPLNSFPYGQHQSAGGFLAIVVGFLWLDRRYFIQVILRTLGLPSAIEDDSNEGLSYRLAVIGGLAGVAFMWWFLERGGMRSWVAGVFILLYFALALAMSRLRAQLGAPAHTMEGMMPQHMLRALVGPRVLGSRTMGMLYLLSPYIQQQDNNATPIQIEGLKMAEDGRMDRRRLALAMAVLAPLTILLFIWANLHIGYPIGMSTGDAHEEMLAAVRYPALDFDAALRYPIGRNDSASIAMGAGFLATLLLMFLKLRFVWWPLHPVAFPTVVGWMTMEMFIPLVLVWTVKVLLLRYGGLKAHRRALPFFLGLLAGGLTSSALGSIAMRIITAR